MFGKPSSLKKKSSVHVESAKSANRYHCVEIKSATRACVAVQEIAGKKFLSEEAPTLPLMDCNVNCTCRYVHFDDRRQKTCRGSFAANSISDKSVKKNCRLGGDRRRNPNARAGYK